MKPELSYDYINPEEVFAGISHLAPFSEEESEYIAQQLTEKHYCGWTRKKTWVDEDDGVIQQDSVQDIKEFFNSVPVGKYVFFTRENDYGSEATTWTFGFKDDPNILDRKIITRISDYIINWRSENEKRKKTEAKEKAKVNSMDSLLKSYQEGKITLEVFNKEARKILT